LLMIGADREVLSFTQRPNINKWKTPNWFFALSDFFSQVVDSTAFTYKV
jgi:hypothetical protein